MSYLTTPTRQRTPTRHHHRRVLEDINAIDFCLISPAPKLQRGEYSPDVKTPPTPDTAGKKLQKIQSCCLKESHSRLRARLGHTRPLDAERCVQDVQRLSLE